MGIEAKAMRVLEEMPAWEALNDEQRGVLVSYARKAIIDVAIEITDIDFDFVSEDGLLVPVWDTGICEIMDAVLIRHLKACKQKGIDRPLIPFHVALWTEAMGIDADELTKDQDIVIALFMLRVRSTAAMASLYSKNRDPDAAHELRRRGILRGQ